MTDENKTLYNASYIVLEAVRYLTVTKVNHSCTTFSTNNNNTNNSNNTIYTSF